MAIKIIDGIAESVKTVGVSATLELDSDKTKSSYGTIANAIATGELAVGDQAYFRAWEGSNQMWGLATITEPVAGTYELSINQITRKQEGEVRTLAPASGIAFAGAGSVELRPTQEFFESLQPAGTPTFQGINLSAAGVTSLELDNTLAGTGLSLSADADSTRITARAGSPLGLGAGGVGDQLVLNTDGSLTSAGDMFHANGTDAVGWSAGSSRDLGGNILAYGQSHATQANDILFRSGTSTKQQWDDSNGFWNFQGNPIVQPTEIYQGTSTGTLKISGGLTTGVGGNIVMYGESHATLANDMQFRAGTTAWLSWDNSAGTAAFAGNVLLSATGNIYKSTTANELFVAGGSAVNLGGNIILRAEAHPSEASDILLRSGSTTRMQWDNSLVEWNFADTPLNRVLAVYSGKPSSQINFSGGSGSALGGNLVMYGETHATLPNNILIRSGSTPILQWEDASSYWNFQGYQVRNVADLYGGPDTQAMEIYGSTTTASANILLYGGTHASKAYDIHFRAGSTDALWYDYSAGLWKVGVTGVVRTTAADSLWLTGGTTTALGGGIRFFGETHATNAGDIYLLSGGTVVSHWNEASGEWNQQGNPFVNVPHIHRASALNTLGLSGGSATGAGGNVILYGESHATNAGDILFRQNTNTVLQYDHSLSLWDFQAKDIKTTGAISVGSSIWAGATSGAMTDASLELDGWTGAAGASTKLVGYGLTGGQFGVQLEGTEYLTLSPTHLQVNGHIAIKDGVTAPSSIAGYASIYVDSADGDLKVRFADGTVKVISTDT